MLGYPGYWIVLSMSGIMRRDRFLLKRRPDVIRLVFLCRRDPVLLRLAPLRGYRIHVQVGA